MIKTIRESLLAVGLESLPIGNNEELNAYGLDSLMVALLYSELEMRLGCSLDVSRFSVECFKSIDSIEKFITENSL